jgi:hypothetical protein
MDNLDKNLRYLKDMYIKERNNKNFKYEEFKKDYMFLTGRTSDKCDLDVRHWIKQIEIYGKNFEVQRIISKMMRDQRKG